MNNTKNKFFVALAIFLGITTVIVFVIWQFLFSKLSLSGENYANNSRVLSEISQKADLKSELKKELENIEEDIETIEGIFLNEHDKLEFIQQIENLALSNGNEYSVKGVQEVKDPKTGDLEEIDFVLNLRGSFGGAFAFLKGIKSMPYIINIKQVDMKAEEGGMVTDVVIKVYLK